MATFHKDIRSESRSYKRDKDTSAKWAHGVRPASGVQVNFWADELTAGTEAQATKVRPHKSSSQESHRPTKSHANYQNPSAYDLNPKACHRMYKKTQTIQDITSSPANVTKSLIDLLPSNGKGNTARSPSIDSGIMYSFDQATSPRNAVGLDGLVEKAEQEWKSRETDNILKKEYEVVNEAGETTVLAQGKKGKRSPRQKPARGPAVSTIIDDEDDWERI